MTGERSTKVALMTHDTLPSSSPPCLHLLAKASGPTSNIDCKYCFFLSQRALYPNNKRPMSEATLETYIRKLLESHRTLNVPASRQSGEPTLIGLKFIRRSVQLVQQYSRRGQVVQHTFQANGILFDHYPIEGALSSAVDAVGVVDLARAIDAKSNQKTVFLEEGAPVVIFLHSSPAPTGNLNAIQLHGRNSYG